VHDRERRAIPQARPREPGLSRLDELALALDRPKLTPEDEKRLADDGQRDNRASE